MQSIKMPIERPLSKAVVAPNSLKLCYRFVNEALAVVVLLVAAVLVLLQMHPPAPSVQFIQSSGRIESEESHVSSLVSGRISAVRIREGDYVHKGQQLISLDSELLQPALSEANRRVAAAEQLLAQVAKQDRTLKEHIAEAVKQEKGAWQKTPSGSGQTPSSSNEIKPSSRQALVSEPNSMDQAKSTPGEVASTGGPAAVSTSGQAAPASGQAAPASGQAAPASSQAAPASSQAAPASSQAAPASSQAASISSQAAPISGQAAPISSQAAPISSQVAPASAQVPAAASGKVTPAPAQTLSSHAQTGSKPMRILTGAVRLLLKPLSAINPAHGIKEQIALAQVNAAKMQAGAKEMQEAMLKKMQADARGMQEAMIGKMQAEASKMQTSANQLQAKIKEEASRMQAKIQAEASKMQAEASKMQAKASKMQAKEQATASRMEAKIQRSSMELMLPQLKSQELMAQAELTKARAMRDELVKKSKQFQIASPINGICTSSAVTNGDVVSAGRILLTVRDPEKTYMRAFVPEGQIASVKIGQPATVILDSNQQKRRLKAHVSSIDAAPSFTPENVYFQDDRVRQVFGLKLRLDKPDGSAKPGMPCDAQIYTQEDKY